MKLKTADYDEHQRRNREVRAAREVAECAAYGSVVAVWLRASSDMGLILACIGLQGVIGFTVLALMIHDERLAISVTSVFRVSAFQH